ncbi:MAG: hypothetical protein RMJ19_03320, partial [Gemmatales bacterium]|nr:hypothetical protein [Gemmatales bacterium]MDW8174679.1 hypothetical protein [Gemmatales bacterium]
MRKIKPKMCKIDNVTIELGHIMLETQREPGPPEIVVLGGLAGRPVQLRNGAAELAPGVLSLPDGAYAIVQVPASHLLRHWATFDDGPVPDPVYYRLWTESTSVGRVPLASFPSPEEFSALFNAQVVYRKHGVFVLAVEGVQFSLGEEYVAECKTTVLRAAGVQVVRLTSHGILLRPGGQSAVWVGCMQEGYGVVEGKIWSVCSYQRGGFLDNATLIVFEQPGTIVEIRQRRRSDGVLFGRLAYVEGDVTWVCSSLGKEGFHALRSGVIRHPNELVVLASKSVRARYGPVAIVAHRDALPREANGYWRYKSWLIGGWRIVGPGIVYVWPGERYEVRMLSHCSELAVAGDS